MTHYPTHYEPQHGQHGPPREQGERIATFPRGRDAEMRVCLATYQDRPYVSLRVWERSGSDGQLYPAKGKGCSIRLSEVGELTAALANLAREHGTDRAPGPDRRRDAPASRGTSTWGSAPRQQQRALPGPTGAPADPPFEPTRRFSEFNDE